MRTLHFEPWWVWCCGDDGLSFHCAHLRYAADVDLFLDTQLCTAHSTASDALWVGVPLLTLTSPTFQVNTGCVPKHRTKAHKDKLDVVRLGNASSSLTWSEPLECLCVAAA